MYHEVHLWYDVNIWIEFTKFMMVIINKTNKVDCMVFRCLWRKKVDLQYPLNAGTEANARHLQEHVLQ